MNTFEIRRLGESLIDLCNETERLRAENANLRNEISALREDMWTSIRNSEQIHVNWVKFCMDPRVEIASEESQS